MIHIAHWEVFSCMTGYFCIRVLWSIWPVGSSHCTNDQDVPFWPFAVHFFKHEWSQYQCIEAGLYCGS